jgi:hypothetical protein
MPNPFNAPTLACMSLMTLLTFSSPSPVFAQGSVHEGRRGFQNLFDGKGFGEWAGDTAVWRVEGGTLVGEVTPTRQIRTNSFLIWRGGRPADFEFIAEYRISERGNSGVNYRSEEVPGIPYAVKGYQLDIDGANTYTGQNYEERGRGFLAMRGQQAVLEAGAKPLVTGSLGDGEALKTGIRKEDWNEIRLVVQGNHMRHYINGVLMSETTDNDPGHRKMEGLLCLQVHTGPSMKVAYRNLRMKTLRKK